MMSKVTIATHNGGFHTDDVFAVAALEMYLSAQGAEEFVVVRTRDEETIAQSDYVLDVGGVYDPEAGRFDHHQLDGPAPRENGVPYAAFGLVWREYGVNICGDELVAKILDERLVQSIDGPDNGVFLSGPSEIEGVYSYFLQDAIKVFNPTWKEDESMADEQFLELVELAKRLIKREIKVTTDVLEGESYVREAYDKAVDKGVIYLEAKYPWKGVLKDLPEPILVIYPDEAGERWRLNAVPEEDFSYEFSFPESWRGRRGEDLQQAAGVEGLIFCHRSLPMIVAKSKSALDEVVAKLIR